MTTISYHDFSAPVLDYAGRPLEIPASATNPQSSVATFAQFAMSALCGTYDEEVLTMEAKTYRSNLRIKIKNNPTAVALEFIDRVILCSLVSKNTTSLLIYERFVEFIERTDIVTVKNQVPVKIDLLDEDQLIN